MQHRKFGFSAGAGAGSDMDAFQKGTMFLVHCALYFSASLEKPRPSEKKQVTHTQKLQFLALSTALDLSSDVIRFHNVGLLQGKVAFMCLMHSGKRRQDSPVNSIKQGEALLLCDGFWS